MGVITLAAWWIGLFLAPVGLHAVAASGQGASGRGAGSLSARQAETYQSAAKEYKALLKARPRSAKLWSNLGAARAMLGDCPGSLLALQRALFLDPKLFAPWFYSGYCHLALHQDGSALNSLEHATALNPKDANAWFLEAQAAGNLNQLALSFEAGVRSLLLDSRRPEAFYLAGEDGLGLTKEQYSQVMAQPSNVFALRLRAERNIGQGVPAAAVSDYQKALALAPGEPDLLFGLGSAYLGGGDYTEAEKEFRRCLDLLPDSAWARLRLILALAAQSRGREADELLSSIQPGRLDSPSEWEDFIAAEYLLGHAGAAEQGLNQAESRFPNLPAWDRWTQRLAAQKAMPDAPVRSDFRFERPASVALSVTFLLTAQPSSGDFVLAAFTGRDDFQAFRAAFLSGEDVRAAARLTRMLRSLPSDPGRAYVTGEILHSLALGFFQRLATDYPDSEPAMVLAARNYSAMGEQAKAIEIYQALLRKAGPSPGVLRDLAKVYWKQHDWDKALPLLRRLTQLDPYDPTNFVNLGRIYSYQQKWEDAELSFRRAARIQPRTYEAHLGLGEVLERRGSERSAIGELKVAERIEPLKPRPHYLLSQIYRKLGEKDLAAREMASFQRLQDRAAPETAGKASRLVPLD
jgi:tetratricopeptide (TPR) repeat protein